MSRRSGSYGAGQSCSDDEELARRLQMEEQGVRPSGGMHEMSYSSAQEREDAELARQVANMDLKSPPSNYPGGGNLKPPPDSSRHRRSTSVDSHEISFSDTGHRRISSEAAAIAHRHEGREKFYQQPRRGRRPGRQSLQEGPASPTKAPPNSQGVRRTSSDDKLAYARRLQEEAFSNIRRDSGESGSSEESDRLLALRMQKEMERQGAARFPENDDDSDDSQERRQQSPWAKYSRNTGSSTPGKNEDKDKRLAEFMSLTGASFSDLSIDLINDIVGNKPGTAGSPTRRTTGSRGDPQSSMDQLSSSANFRRSLEQGGSNQTRTNSLSSKLASISRDSLKQATPGAGAARPMPSGPPESIPPPDHGVGGSLIGTRSLLPGSDEVASASLRSSRSVYPGVDPTIGGSMRTTRSIKPVMASEPLTPTRAAHMSYSEHHTSPRIPVAPLSSFSDHLGVPPNSAKKKKKKKKKRFLRSLGLGGSDEDELNSEQAAQIPGDIPLPPPIPPANLGPANFGAPPPISPIKTSRGVVQHPMHPTTPTRSAQRGVREIPVSPLTPGTPSHRGYTVGSRQSPMPRRMPATPSLPRNTQRSVCVVCSKTTGTFLSALDQKFHPECFRCVACRGLIDPNGQFKFSEGDSGRKQPYHIKCYAEVFGIKCSVCRHAIPASNKGAVAFVKHPFFDKELMCIKHADHPVRVCSGCKRFEPYDKPFVDLGDNNRCVCPACFKSVVIDDADVNVLWKNVISFFEHVLKLPIWPSLRCIPVLLISSDTLREQLNRSRHAHDGAKQLMCSGMCLTDHDASGRLALMPELRYDESSKSFRSRGRGESGYFESPQISGRKTNNVNVIAISCLYGLPRALTSAVLAHEALHAWFQLHPKYSPHNPIPPDVEEGCAQLVSMLFLSDGLGPPARTVDDADGPSDERMRQYLKFSIERDTSETFGVGYRKAADVYRNLGMEALLNHVLHYKSFPHT